MYHFQIGHPLQKRHQIHWQFQTHFIKQCTAGLRERFIALTNMRTDMAAWRAFSLSSTVYLLLYLVSLFMRNNVFTSTSKNVGCELTTLFLDEEASSPRISYPVSCRKKSASGSVMALSIKLLVAIRILR